MKNKFIRIIQPLSLLALFLLDMSALLLLYLIIKRIISGVDFYSVCLIIIDMTVLITGAVSTRQLLKSGVKISEDKIEFTALDKDNLYSFSNIKKAEYHRDSKASFRKSFTDRYSSIIFYLKDGSVATVELGFTTKRTLNKIADEINKRTSK